MNKETENMGKHIPEGYVFVAKGEGVAAGLLDAADELGADRKFDVRTQTGGYLVREDVAAAYNAKLPEVEVDEDDGGADPTDDPDATEDEVADELVDGDPDDEKPGLPDESWTVKEIDAWAGKQDPPVEFPTGANKPAKLAQIHA